MNKTCITILVLAGVIVLGFFTSQYVLKQTGVTPPASTITSFEECAKVYPVGESYPAQCWTPDGRHFAETISIETIKTVNEASLMSVPGVVGVGIGECNAKPCVKVFLEKETPESKKIPTEINGFEVRKEVTGQINIQ